VTLVVREWPISGKDDSSLKEDDSQNALFEKTTVSAFILLRRSYIYYEF
jgi:hypothetical protein